MDRSEDREAVASGRLEPPYAPLRSQFRFHSSKARFKGFSGPVGSGKSAALCHEALLMALRNPGRTGVLAAPTFNMLRDATLPALESALSRGQYEYEYNKSEGKIVLKVFESIILLRSLDDPDRLRGTNLAWFGVDELTYASEESWLRLEARLRDPEATWLGGFAVWTPRGYDWVWRRFVGDRIEGYELICAEPYENNYILETTPDYYEQLKRSYTSDFFAQEVLGQYLAPKAGLVYSQFDRGRNLENVEWDPDRPLLWALDFNVDPMSSLVVQGDSEGLRVVDEIVIRRSGTRDACEELVRRYPNISHGLVVYADASAHQGRTSGWSDREVLQDCFANLGIKASFRIPKCNPPVRRRVELVNGRLHNAAGEVELVVNPRCKELIQDFECVAWVEGTYEIDKQADSLRTHLSDALGYLVWEEYNRVVATVGYKSKRLI